MVQPILFGKSGQQLFGAYHPPEERRPRDAAVVLCYPAVQEYMRTHWAFRKLAGLLSREGLHVLRFDYFGTGDSAGGSHQVTATRSAADIRAAATELRDLADVRRVSLVGLRWGATLATQAVAQGLEVQDLVLWEPAVDGRSHLADLAAIQAVRFQRFDPLGSGDPGELLGYPLDAAQRAEMEAIDLAGLSRLPASRILIFSSRARPEHESLLTMLRDREGRPPTCHVIPEDAAQGHEGVLLSTKVLQAIATAVGGGTA
jgi:pimeloyl-ACP methyl ester carboxylesterase